jgi:hypothetical protein
MMSLAVHFDAASLNQFLGFTPRGHAGTGEEFGDALALYFFAGFILHS